MTALDDKLGRVELALARWHCRLYRAASTIKKLDTARKRLELRIEERKAPKPSAPPDPDLNDGLDDLLREAEKPETDELIIPGFLKRTPNPADEAAKAGIIAEQRDAKKKKAAARKAKEHDGLAKMPLTGKAALEAIKG